MSRVERSLLVPYTCAQMYELVADLESYPQFLPGCGSARILSRDGDRVCGEVQLNFKGIKRPFSTCNRMRPSEGIDMKLKDGPFSELSGGWTFQNLSRGDVSGCKISLILDYEFSSRMLRIALGPVFEVFAKSLVDAFDQRAKAIHG